MTSAPRDWESWARARLLRVWVAILIPVGFQRLEISAVSQVSHIVMNFTPDVLEKARTFSGVQSVFW